MHSQTFGRVNAWVHERELVLFQELFNATTIFLQLRHYLLDLFQEVRVGPIKTSIYGFNMLLRSIIAVELTNSSTWYFNQQVGKQNTARLASEKKPKGFCSFLLRVIISEFFVK